MLRVVTSLSRGRDLGRTSGGGWPPSEEPDPDEEQYQPPPSLVVTAVLVGTLFVMAIVGALLDWMLSVVEPRGWENVEQGIGAFATMLR